MPPRGRPRNEEETCVLSVRLPVTLRDELDRYLDRLEIRQGIKASRTDMIRHALRRFLEGNQTPAPEMQPEQPTIEIEPTSRNELILEYFAAHPNQNLRQQEVAAWVRAEFQRRTGEQCRDPERQIRELANKGTITKVRTGIYRYDEAKV